MLSLSRERTNHKSKFSLYSKINAIIEVHVSVINYVLSVSASLCEMEVDQATDILAAFVILSSSRWL